MVKRRLAKGERGTIGQRHVYRSESAELQYFIDKDTVPAVYGRSETDKYRIGRRLKACSLLLTPSSLNVQLFFFWLFLTPSFSLSSGVLSRFEGGTELCWALETTRSWHGRPPILNHPHWRGDGGRGEGGEEGERD